MCTSVAPAKSCSLVSRAMPARAGAVDGAVSGGAARPGEARSAAANSAAALASVAAGFIASLRRVGVADEADLAQPGLGCVGQRLRDVAVRDGLVSAQMHFG